jgi:hypothetical protein
MSNACAIKNRHQASGFRLQAGKRAYGLNLLRFFFATTPAAAVFQQYKTGIGERKSGGSGKYCLSGSAPHEKKCLTAGFGIQASGLGIRDNDKRPSLRDEKKRGIDRPMD